MTSAKEIRDKLLRSFRAELSEHIQTMTAGLLQIEQASTTGGAPEQEVLNTTFRAAHSLKGAARAMGVTAIEQLAHAQESILDHLRRGENIPSAEMFTVFYQSLDAIQLVQAAYEAGETTPPAQALISLIELEKHRVTIGQASETRQVSEAPAASGQTHPDPSQKETAPLPFEQNEAQIGQGLAYPNNNDETIRVDVEKLDALMANLSDLFLSRIRMEQRQEQLSQLREQFDHLQHAWSFVRGPFNHLMRQKDGGLLSLHRHISVDSYETLNNSTHPHRPLHHRGANHKLNTINPKAESWPYVRKDDFNGWIEVSKNVEQMLRYISASQERLETIYAQIENLSRQFTADTLQLSLIIDGMEEDIKRLRLQPFNTITTTFTRMVRDLARQSGKEAALTILGGDTEIDKRVLEAMKDPLIHLLRNAIDHGIETPEKRQSAGKSRTGQITISAERAGNDIVVRVSDDGAGLDIDAIRQAVTKTALVKHGTLDPKEMTESELIETIFSLGISTSAMITDVSGRGVGLSVVRSNVEALHGRLTIAYQRGEGTTFSLFMPLSLTGMRGLMVCAAGQLFAIPIDSVERTLALTPEEIFSLEGHDSITYEGRPVPLVYLSDTLDLPNVSKAGMGSPQECLVVVLSVKDRYDQRLKSSHKASYMAFIVDQLAGEQEIVIKDLGRQLAHVAGIAGATVLGSGEVALVLNAADLVKLASRQSRRSILEAIQSQAEDEAQSVPKSILVVDDSITTRTLEKNILEAAGYRVSIATDGQEALEQIRVGKCPDLIVTDIVMPRMDGFELTQQLKSDPRTSHLPVILVTSLESAEDKQRGIAVQADAYIVKSSFDQANLLETIEQLI